MNTEVLLRSDSQSNENSLWNLLFPQLVQRQETLRNKGTRFVHYTGVDAFMNIIRSKEVWLRSVDCMNDYMEVDYGLKQLKEAYYNSEKGGLLRKTLNSAYNNFSNRFDHMFWGWAPHLRGQTYIFCMSEHKNEEDPYGRLSMWRAYGKDTRLAIVLKQDPFLRPSDALKAYTNPVEYLDKEGYQRWFDTISSGLISRVNEIHNIEEDIFFSYIFYCFLLSVLCTKHPGFSEECEWRVVYTDRLETSGVLGKEIRNIGGSPQTIYKIPLKNRPKEELTGIEIPELLDRVIYYRSDATPDINTKGDRGVAQGSRRSRQ